MTKTETGTQRMSEAEIARLTANTGPRHGGDSVRLGRAEHALMVAEEAEAKRQAVTMTKLILMALDDQEFEAVVAEVRTARRGA